jgi:flagellar biosynthesis anti-sigma factor FlgM
MKITDHPIGPIGPSATGRPGEASGVTSDTARSRDGRGVPAATEDKVSVSEEARTLSRLRGELGDVDGVRAEKVDEIRGQIERGEYRPDLKQTARKLLEAIFGDRTR